MVSGGFDKRVMLWNLDHEMSQIPLQGHQVHLLAMSRYLLVLEPNNLLQNVSRLLVLFAWHLELQQSPTTKERRGKERKKEEKNFE